MPTFSDPRKDSLEASSALRGLAHASRDFDDPADTYPVIGDLLGGVRALEQTFRQLREAHLVHLVRAHDDHGDRGAGFAEATAAVDELERAAELLDEVEEAVDAALGHSGRIAWLPEPALGVPPEEPPRRWLGVVFLEGTAADKALGLIDRAGAQAAIEYLSRRDHDAETTAIALENGYVYDVPPEGALDRVVVSGDYALTYNLSFRRVSLLRAHREREDPGLDDDAPARRRERIRRVPGSAREQDWFASRPAGSVREGRSL